MPKLSVKTKILQLIQNTELYYSWKQPGGSCTKSQNACPMANFINDIFICVCTSHPLCIIVSFRNVRYAWQSM